MQEILEKLIKDEKLIKNEWEILIKNSKLINEYTDDYTVHSIYSYEEITFEKTIRIIEATGTVKYDTQYHLIEK